MTDPAALPLREIHLPVETGWWPPAPGWWLLTGLVLLVALILLLIRRRRIRRMYSAINMAREELKEIKGQYDRDEDAKSCIQSISVLLRRLCISVFPRMETASLTGEQWLRFLDAAAQQSPLHKTFSGNASANTGEVLITAPYRKQVESHEVEPLVEHCFEWLEALHHELRKKKP